MEKLRKKGLNVPKLIKVSKLCFIGGPRELR